MLRFNEDFSELIMIYEINTIRMNIFFLELYYMCLQFFIYSISYWVFTEIDIENA